MQKRKLHDKKKLSELLYSPVVFIIAFAVVIFLFFYWTDLLRPGVLFERGYYEIWYDQSQYYNMSVSISNGNLGDFKYPIGYPLLGFVGYLVYQDDPFVIVNLICFVIFIWLCYQLSKKVFRGTLALLSAILTAVLTVPMFSVPWTSTLSATCFIYIIYFSVYEKKDWLSNIIAGACVGLSFSARIGDFLPVFAVLAGHIIFVSIKNKSIKSRYLLGILVAIIIILMTIIVNIKFSGDPLGNYGNAVLGNGLFSVASMPYRLLGYFFNPFPFEGETHSLSVPLLKLWFLFVLVPLGLIRIFYDREKRYFSLLCLISFVSWGTVYFGFSGISGYALKFTSFHYLKMLFPMFVILSLYFLQDITVAHKKPAKGIRGFLIYILCMIAIGVAFINLFGFSAINMGEIDAFASENSENTELAFDGQVNTMWVSENNRAPDMEFLLDLKASYLINGLQFDPDTSSQNKNNEIDIYFSDNKNDWDKILFIGRSELSLNKLYIHPRFAQYIKIVSKKSSDTPWSIREIAIIAR